MGDRTPRARRAAQGKARRGQEGSEKMDQHPIERFDPLLRNMLAWNLVEETEAGGWALRPEVADRLGGLAKYAKGSQPSEIVYFGHVCAGCKSNGLTRLREGQYLCDDCRKAADLAAVATLLPEPEARKARRFTRSRKIAS
jgi:ribosomal protein L37AE/L43A